MSSKLKLWHLKMLRDWDYDEADAFVVRAETEEQARRLASREAGDEKASTWLLPASSDCTELVQEGDARIILRSFNAG